jgi:hypothetical protein
MVAPEPVQVALSLASSGRFADAFGPGSGPTAHCSPLLPLVLSLFFRLLGTGSAAIIAMTALGCAASAAAFALLPSLAEAAGLELTTGVWAGVAGAILPFNFWAQTSGTFEAPFASLALTALCLLFSGVWRRNLFSVKEAVMCGFVSGTAFLTTPVLIPVVVACSVAAGIRLRSKMRHVAVFVCVAAACALVTLAPWATRNYLALGEAVWTRDNFPLELQVSNNDSATADLERNVRLPGFALVHPFTGVNERARVIMLGEIAYEKSKKQQAWEWIDSHPKRFALLTVERVKLFWFPHMSRTLQSFAEGTLSVLGLCGLAGLIWRHQQLAGIGTATFLSYPAVYYLIQVSPRYRFPLEPLLFLFSAALLTNARSSRSAVK